MKNFHDNKPLRKFAGVILASSAIAGPVFTGRVTAADPAIVREAQQLCIDNARTKGFELKEVVSSGDADVAGKDAKIILTLLKDGRDFKQTCYYDKNAKSVSFGEEIAATLTPPAVTVPPAKTYSPALWWMLLPIVGLPALLWWAENRRIGPARTVTIGARNASIAHSEALIRGEDGNPVQVYKEPSYSSRVLGTVDDGQLVRLTGRENDDWFELVGGGWLPKQYARTFVTG
ncbi:SH3 domain-containing protein [Pannus brasiliensis CCIBt3594]|uniref:SH3 domain-containing protein n=1 Tax=Pannus brasiliensis CCIBt3594 TaxID=1427578 RepID=A0AAW9QXP1_9CHRO